MKRIYADNELEREAAVKLYLTVQTEGEREVQRKVEHYSLQAIIAVGFKIENERAVQFRKWANQIVKDRSGPEKSSSRISGISASMSDGSRRSTGAENNEKTSP